MCYVILTISRLIGRPITNKLFGYEKNIVYFIRPVSIKPTKALPPCEDSHDERNTKIGRPYSPHLTIYAPQLTSMLSLSHRATGKLKKGTSILLILNHMFISRYDFNWFHNDSWSNSFITE